MNLIRRHLCCRSVSVRLRPLSERESEGAWRAEGSKILPLPGTGSEAVYHLDNVFDEKWTTAQVGLGSVV